ncbi:DNA cytosine methyltransferase [Streptomyces sp. NBUA17]|uniref:DNA cytosine methyltransferase n=1 Tax=Streptomyces sp. NBUA17 TaxID=3062275 RepID=UPI0037DA476A
MAGCVHAAAFDRRGRVSRRRATAGTPTIPGTAVTPPRRTADEILAATARPVPPVPGQQPLFADGLRIGSLFSGYGGLDMGVQAVLGGEIAWHCQYDPEDKFQYAARILAHHWPEVRNLGDIRFVHWLRTLRQYGPVDVLTGGFPCTDLSVAGHRLGIALGTRSGLWHYMLRAIAILRPRLVVIENVRGILSTKADRGVGADAPDMDPSSGARYVLRALGAVLGDLATVGFDAEWAGVRASEVGAPHERFREFILAWPADADGPRLEGRGIQGAVAERLAAAADPARLGPEGHRPAWRGGPDLRTAISLLPTPTAADSRDTANFRPDGTPYSSGYGKTLTDATRLLPTPTASPYGSNQSPSPGAAVRLSLDGAARKLLPTPRASDGEKGGPNQRGSSGDLTLPSVAAGLGNSSSPAATSSSTGASTGRRSSSGKRSSAAPPLAN